MVTSPRRTFRSAPSFLAYLAVQAAFLAGATTVLWRTAGWDWLTMVLAGATLVIGVGGLLEAWRTQVVLSDDALQITTLWASRRIPRAEIRLVRAERGSPPAIQLADGTWVRLPSLGKQLAHAVRGWLEASPSVP